MRSPRKPSIAAGSGSPPRPPAASSSLAPLPFRPQGPVPPRPRLRGTGTLRSRLPRLPGTDRALPQTRQLRRSSQAPVRHRHALPQRQVVLPLGRHPRRPRPRQGRRHVRKTDPQRLGSHVAPQAQLNIGAAREIQKEWGLAVRAYERAADRYNDKREVASQALLACRNGPPPGSRSSRIRPECRRPGRQRLHRLHLALPQRFPRSRSPANASSTSTRSRPRATTASPGTTRRNDALDGALIYYNEVVDIYARLVKDPQAARAQEARERIALVGARRSRQKAADGDTNAPPAIVTAPSTNTPPASAPKP